MCGRCVASDYQARVSHRDGGYHVGVSHQDDFYNIEMYIKMVATMVGLSITQDWWLPSHLGVSAGDVELLFFGHHIEFECYGLSSTLGQLPH